MIIISQCSHIVRLLNDEKITSDEFSFCFDGSPTKGIKSVHKINSQQRIFNTTKNLYWKSLCDYLWITEMIQRKL